MHDDDDLSYPALERGMAEGVSGPAPDDGKPIAVLWLPDPEQRRGWRELYVKRPDPPEGRRIGFRQGMA